MTEREAFEAHMLNLNPCTRLARQKEEVGGQYRTITVQRAWELWQESRKQAVGELIGWISWESLHFIKRGGNGSKGTVPIHATRSNVSKYPLYLSTPDTEGGKGC